MESKDIAKKEENSLAVDSKSLGMEGVEGFNMSDLPMPFVKLVHATSKNVELAAGGRANPGTWYHTTKKEAKEDLAVVFFYAKKVKTENPRNPDEILDGVRILAVTLDELDNPFAMQFTKGGYWAYKRLLGAMKAWKMKSMYERYVILGSKTVESKEGDEFLVPTMDLSEPLTKEQLACVSMVVEQFGGKIDEVEASDEEPIKEDLEPSVNVDLDEVLSGNNVKKAKPKAK